MRYTYDPELTHGVNRERAIAAHSEEGPPVAITRGDGSVEIRLFPDGAYLTTDDPREHVSEPFDPSDPYLRNQHPMDAADRLRETRERIIRYWGERVRRAVKGFEDLKAALLAAADKVPPTRKDVERLEAMKEGVANCRAKLDAALAVLNPPPRPLTPEELEAGRRMEEKKAAAVAAVNAVTL